MRPPLLAAFLAPLLLAAPGTHADHEILWCGGAFDPLDAGGVPPVAAALAPDADTRLFIVQFTGPMRADDGNALRALGAELHDFVPRHARLVTADGEAVGAIRALPRVRWVGPYAPAWRLHPELARRLARGGAATATYNVMAVDPERKAAVGTAVRDTGGEVIVADAGHRLVRARLDAKQLRAVAHADDVVFIDAWGPFAPDMDVVRRITGADFIEAAGGYDGSGVRGEVLDVGFNLDHPDFASRPLIEHHPVSDGTHGTSTVGICFGDGTGDPRARGLLPMGQGVVIGIDYMQGANRYEELGELDFPPYECVFQSCSVGSPRTVDYTTTTAEMDTALFDHDILVCQSLGNSGTPEGRPEAWAKNIVAVGGVFHNDTVTFADDAFTGASTGPAADGRVKPDLHSVYDGVYTTAGADGYGNFGGTSASTAIVAGCAGLFHELWADGLFGNPVDPDGSVFTNRPHMSTAKAMLVNSARQYPFDGATDEFARMRQGWGAPDLRHLYRSRALVSVIDETEILASFETHMYCVDVGPDAPALAITLVYADPAGIPFSAMHRVNDLSVRATSPSGTVYWGNHGLDVSPWSTPDGSADEINTVENVFVEAPEWGAWDIEVIASEVNLDGHVETPKLDADYALVINRAPRVGACPADVDGDGAVGTGDLLVVLGAWGVCTGPCGADVDGDGRVGVGDVLAVLARWGECS